MRRHASASPVPVFIVLFALFFGILSSCSDLEVNVLDDAQSVVTGDSTLPDGFVAENRPPNPPVSYTVPCPLGTVAGGVANPNVTLGCPFVDCIPAIDNPRFGSVEEAGAMMTDFERIMVIERDGMVRGLPIRILIYHEVVNMCWNLPDGSQSYSVVTYCPIVDVAMHFLRPSWPCGRTRRFSYGVSSGIYNGNLIIYQRSTAGTVDGAFVQMYGGGINNDCLEIERVNLDMRWDMFARLYPNAQVLMPDVDNPPPGGYDIFEHPYAEFWLSNDFCVNGLCFPVSDTDSRFPKKTLVYGVFTPNETKAYRLVDLDRLKVVNDQVGGVDVVVWGDRASGVAFEPVADGQKLTFSWVGRDRQGLPLFKDAETGSMWTFDGIGVSGPLKGKRLAQVVGYRAFWFSWYAFFPQTLSYEPPAP